MAIGTTGGKIGYVVGPLIAVPALFISADWFGLSEDSGPWYALPGWLLFGLVAAVAAGLSVRWAFNRFFDVKSRGF